MLLVSQQCPLPPEVQVRGLKVRQSLPSHPMSDHRACTELSYWEGGTLVVGVESLPFWQGSRRMQQVLPKAS